MEAKPKYDFKLLEQFFEDMTSPEEIINHLEMLLQFLVYYGDKEKVHGLYDIYCDIFVFKQALQELTTE